jgi:hypothetical protein
VVVVVVGVVGVPPPLAVPAGVGDGESEGIHRGCRTPRTEATPPAAQPGAKVSAASLGAPPRDPWASPDPTWWLVPPGAHHGQGGEKTAQGGPWPLAAPGCSHPKKILTRKPPSMGDQWISGSVEEGAPTEEPRPDASNARSQRPATRETGVSRAFACVLNTRGFPPQRGEAHSTTRHPTQDPRPGEAPDWLKLSLAVFTAMQPSFAFEVTAPAPGGSP